MLRYYSVKIITLKSLPGSSITVSTDIMKSPGLKPGGNLSLQAGNKTVRVRMLGTHGTAAGTSVFLSEKVRDSLLLPTPLILNLISGDNSDIWRLGPVIGIFANRTENSGRPFGEQTGFFRKLNSVGKNLNSLCFAFGPDDIDWESKVIRGTIPPLPDTDQGWQTVTLPFPDAVYDRGLFPKGEKRRAASESRKILRNYPGIKFFNPAFFGKWKTHKLLSKHEVLQEHLPETMLLRSGTEIFELLERHGTVYIKPSGGSSGRGIIRITANSGGYVVSLRISRQVKSINFSDRVKLRDFILNVVGQTRYIVQQGLNLVTLHSSPLDIRVLMQKNLHGVWHRTGMAARVAGKGNYISNIHAGGRAAKISSILPLIFSDLDKVQNIQNDISRLSSLIAAWVSSEGNPLFGEIAVDLGIDTTGKIWIIELNAIPGRTVFRRIGAMKIAAHALSRPMEYACFLSGFAPQLNK